MAARQRALHLNLQRHLAGVRAFHAGLVAETQRRFELLNKVGQHIDCLRRLSSTPHQKLHAAEESCRHLSELRKTHRPWHETYTDLTRYMRQVRHHLRRMVNLT
jgi:hypothetical protein